ncbi:uncharacterized protein [Palaemon carinicauda]|uniref:uncharacterized protein n=1 Tax=Palaemon carinicauda TaxID=392227 RepID=UPI0035B5EE6D
MFQRTLILAAISAAFAQGPQIDSCQRITSALQTAFRSDDPHTFPDISNFIYTRDNIRYNIDFFDLIFRGFSNVRCSSAKGLGRQQVTTLNLTGHDLEFDTSNFRLHINPPFSAVGQRPSFDLKVQTYALELIFTDEVFTLDPFKLCITRDTLEMTFRAEGMVFDIKPSPPVAQELNNHPAAVLKAINLYLPRFANDLTTKLNDILCVNTPPTAAIPNSRPSPLPFGIPDYP